MNRSIGVLFIFGTSTGLRLSDMLKLRSSDISPSMAILEAKTGKLRHIHLDAPMLNFMREYIALEKLAANALLWPYSRQWVHKVFKRVAKDLGLHSFRTPFNAQDIRVESFQTAQGHTSTKAKHEPQIHQHNNAIHHRRHRVAYG